jgi:hypothetical protein
MTWNDIANPRFLSILIGALAPARPASTFEARRRRWLADIEDGAATDFEDTAPCRWLLTEPPPLDEREARQHVTLSR